MNFKTNKIKLIAMVMILMLLFSITINLVSCAYVTDMFEKITGGSYLVSQFHCSYEIDKEEYDINCVTLLFFYGVGLGEDINIELETSVNYPVFELYFMNDEDTSILAKHVEENLISEKYGFTYGPNNKEIYNHSEKFTIPKELFTKESGIIWFYLYGANILESSSPKAKIITSIAIYYTKNGDSITLSKEAQS